MSGARMNLAHAETRRTTNQTTNITLAAIISKTETTQIIQTMRRPDGFMGCQTRRIYQRQSATRCQRAHRFR
jgi:hypothetical protein